VTHGTCALDGKHPPGSKYAAECPLAKRQRRSEAAVVREAAKPGRGASTAGTSSVRLAPMTGRPCRATLVRTCSFPLVWSPTPMDSAYSTAKAALIGEETLAESQRLRMHADKLRAQITAGEETLAENQRLRMRTAELAAQVRPTLFTSRRHRFPHLSGASDPADGTPLRELASAEAGRAAAEAAARVAPLAEQRLRVTLASIGDAVIATDVDGRVTLINRVAAELTGWSSADAVGKQLEDVFVIRNELTNQLVENPVAKVLRQGAVVGLANHTVLIAKDGRRIPIGDSAAPIQTADGQLLGVVLVFRDMTAQRDHERTLFRLAAIAESSEDAILTKTFDGLITSWNPGAELMFGYSTNEAVGQPITM